ncbi:M1 family metallopeptidase [Sporocytophaga myxococcoides]|uniref:M1 family metallopeptidase n=1 Tax=Sporocytophaga myxococcoides TaxID=153721 RepID=UPI00048FF76E|nr:M1 family metallopeptidase [Sporocytophaga myxococcoides]
MYLRFFSIILSLQFIYHCGRSQTKSFTRYDTLRGSLSPLRACYDVHFYNLKLQIDPDKKHIMGSNSIHFKVIEPFIRVQVDLYSTLRVDSIRHHNETLNFERDSNAVFINFKNALKPYSLDSISIYYSGNPFEARNPPWEGGFIWSKDTEGKPWVGVSCEGDGASLWWPCKDHPSDEADSVQLTFSVPKGLKCISNGNLEQEVCGKDFHTYKWKVHYPINNYNVTLNIGNYAEIKDEYIRADSSTLDLRYYVLQKNKDKAWEYFQQVKPMLKCFEQYFGKYPFPKDGYALIETPYLGMEHQSAIAYGNKFRKNMLGYDYIVIHESAHEWWGNNVSACDHGDLWIQESFTTYAEALFVECMFDFTSSVNYLFRQRNYIKNSEPIKGPSNVNYHYWKDSDMYYKGSWMLHTLRSVIDNDSLWFSILKEIQHQFSQKQICSDELINFISQKGMINLRPFFDQYLLHTDIPIFEYKVKRKKNKFYLVYRMRASVNGFTIPVKLKLQSGKAIVLIADQQFKKVELEENDLEDFKIPTDLYYISSEKLN